MGACDWQLLSWTAELQVRRWSDKTLFLSTREVALRQEDFSAVLTLDVSPVVMGVAPSIFFLWCRLPLPLRTHTFPPLQSSPHTPQSALAWLSFQGDTATIQSGISGMEGSGSFSVKLPQAPSASEDVTVRPQSHLGGVPS